MSNGSQPSEHNVKLSKKAHPTFHFASGLASGVASAILLQPADLLKTRVQQSRSSSLLSVLRSILASPNPTAKLWRGTLPSVLRTGFGSAIYFSTLSSFRQVVANNQAKKLGNTNSRVEDGALSRSSSVLPKLSNAQNMLTGATARVFAGFVLMPFTVIKVRYESDLYAYRSLLGASRDIISKEGFKGFFSGFGATAVRDAPYAGLYVVFYEMSKKRLNASFDASSAGTSAAMNASSGVIAAGLATAITNPFDAVKTRLQLMPGKYGNMVKATRMMLKEDGLKAFFDGLGLRMGRKAISSALAWTVYEELIGRAEKRFVQENSSKELL